MNRRVMGYFGSTKIERCECDIIERGYCKGAVVPWRKIPHAKHCNVVRTFPQSSVDMSDSKTNLISAQSFTTAIRQTESSKEMSKPQDCTLEEHAIFPFHKHCQPSQVTRQKGF